MSNLERRITRLERAIAQREKAEAENMGKVRALFASGMLAMTPAGVTAATPDLAEIASDMTADMATYPDRLVILLTSGELRGILAGREDPLLLAAFDLACKVAAAQMGVTYNPADRLNWARELARIKGGKV
jgi:hypothetical protein